MTNNPRSAEDVARNLVIKWGADFDHPGQFQHEIKDIAEALKKFRDDGVSEDRNIRTADDLYKLSYQRGFAECKAKALKEIKCYMRPFYERVDRVEALQPDGKEGK